MEADVHQDLAVYLGIDVGSTTTKAIAFSADGVALATGVAGYPTARPTPDRAEQDPGDWIAAVDECVARVAEQVHLRHVLAIGITSQVDTHLAVDVDLRPLTPAIMWQDLRAATEARDLNGRLGEDGRRAGWGDPRPLDASNPVARALWLARHMPDSWVRCRWLMLPKDYVIARLTGVVGADPQASFKVVGADGQYVPGVAHADGLAERLPPLGAPEQPAGRTLREWHGVPAGTMVARSTMDAFANVLGSGLHHPGNAMMVLGTSVIVAMIGVGGTSGPGVVSFVPFRGRQVHAGPTQSGGDSLRWWARASGHTVEEVLAAAADARPGSGGVVFAPHLLGERAPLWDSEVRGWFTGVHTGTGFPELSRAVLEGVAYSARELLDAVEVAAGATADAIVVSGGGSRSDLWCRILADVAGRRIRRTAQADTAVVGAAVLAAAAHGSADPWEQAAALSLRDLECAPVPEQSRVLDQLYAVYRQTYECLQPVHHVLGRLAERDGSVRTT
jgi:xylulokinase